MSRDDQAPESMPLPPPVVLKRELALDRRTTSPAKASDTALTVPGVANPLDGPPPASRSSKLAIEPNEPVEHQRPQVRAPAPGTPPKFEPTVPAFDPSTAHTAIAKPPTRDQPNVAPPQETADSVTDPVGASLSARAAAGAESRDAAAKAGPTGTSVTASAIADSATEELPRSRSRSVSASGLGSASGTAPVAAMPAATASPMAATPSPAGSFGVPTPATKPAAPDPFAGVVPRTAAAPVAARAPIVARADLNAVSVPAAVRAAISDTASTVPALNPVGAQPSARGPAITTAPSDPVTTPDVPLPIISRQVPSPAPPSVPTRSILPPPPPTPSEPLGVSALPPISASDASLPNIEAPPDAFAASAADVLGEAIDSEVRKFPTEVHPPLSGENSAHEIEALEVIARPASLWRRIGAYVVDTVLFCALLAGATRVLIIVHGLTKGPRVHFEGGVNQVINQAAEALKTQAIPFAALSVALLFGWVLVFSWRFSARSPGRALFGLHLLDGRGQRPSLLRALWRTSVAMVSVAIGLGGFWLALFDRRGQALHDKLSATFVVRLTTEHS